MKENRKLAAILFTDIVGYTALMGADEKQAVATVNRYQATLEQCVRDHEGEILNYYGDGSLVIFSSSVEAVRCACDLQSALSQGDSDEPAVPLRLGIHIGEILLEDGKVFGDGVNIASRIESLGQPGAVLFSGSVNDKLSNLPEFRTVSLGRFEFKNVPQPIEVFALANEGFAVPKREGMTGKLKLPSQKRRKAMASVLGILAVFAIITSMLWFLNKGQKPAIAASLTERPAIAVLPFRNLSGDPTQEYFSDGITTEIITELAGIKRLSVISETSVLGYKNPERNLKRIADELGVPLILEGTVTVIDDKVRISAQLIEAETDLHLWAERYDTLFSRSDLLKIQVDLAKMIVDVVNVQLRPEEKVQLERLSTHSIEAYDLYLRARAETRSFNLYQSIDYLEKALAIDPDFVQAYTLLAWNYVSLTWPRYMSYEVPIEEAKEYAIPAIEKAIALNPAYSDAYLVKGAVEFMLNWDFEAADKSFQKGMELASWPDAPTEYCFCAFIQFLYVNKRFEEALNIANTSEKIDPTNFFNKFDPAIIYHMTNRQEEAIKMVEEGLAAIPWPAGYLGLGNFYYHAGNMGKALEFYEIADSLYEERPPRLDAYFANVFYRLGRVKESDAILRHLYDRKSEGETYVTYEIALVESDRKNYSQALDLLEEAFRYQDWNFAYITADLEFKGLENNARFQNLLRKVGYQLVQ